LPSTDTRYATHTKYPSPRFARATVDAHLYNSVCNLEAAARCAPREHRKSGETLTHNRRPLAHLRAIEWGVNPMLHVACQWPDVHVFG
jgi:hypothetical protein